MLPTRLNVLAAVLLLAAATGLAKTPKCTPRRKECRDPRARCVANALAEGCTGSRKKCRREAKRACRAEIKRCCTANPLDTCCNATAYPTTTTVPGATTTVPGTTLPGATTTTLPSGPNASLNVTILKDPAWGPPGAGWKIEEQFPPNGTPRISCPPTCAYQAPTPSLDVFKLAVLPVNDPRTQNPPWNIIAMDQCTHTSSLPSSAPLCDLPSEGHVNVTVTLQYRPIVAVRFSGKTGDPGLAYVQGYGVAPVGNGYGLSCYSESSPVPDCAEHLDAGTGWQFRTVSYQLPDHDVPYALQSWTSPCTGGPGTGENLCTPSGFIIPGADVCVLATFSNPTALPDKTIPAGTCPTGPGDG